MKRFSLRLAAILLTSFTGIAAVTGWIYNRIPSDVQNVEIGSGCDFPEYADTGLIEDGKGISSVLTQGFREIPFEVIPGIKDRIPACIDETYRLTWIPAFSSSVMVRVWRVGEQYFLRVKKLDGNGKGAYGLGEIAIDKTRLLTESEWRNIISRLDRAAFWSLPPNDNNLGMPYDGAGWLIEARKGAEYRPVLRRLPDDDYREISAYLISLSSIETDYAGY